MALINNFPANSNANGTTTQRWFQNGYKKALEDIAAIVDNAGEKPWGTASQRLNDIRDYIEQNHTGFYFTE